MTFRLYRLAAFPMALLLFLGGCATRPLVPLSTVESVDPVRYAGVWYEMALLPNRFQAMCIADTQARYQFDGDVIRVLNRCRKADGLIEEASGVAKSVPGSNGARLRVSFFRPFYGDYWVLALDPDYRWVLVGEPRRQYAWVLARQPGMDAATLDAILDRAAALGFERAAFRRTPQTRPLAAE